ncbi:MAG: class I SAM-dependent methyltransferase [Salinirussus sp.]
MTPDERSRAGVRATFDRIASHFSQTRQRAWPAVAEFLGEAGPAELGLDAGCGNGRHLEPLGERVDRAIGLDFSRGILNEAVDRLGGSSGKIQLLQAEIGTLPLRDDCIDVALCIATIHHLPNQRARIEALREVGRVLDPAGCGLISAWSVTHDKFDATSGFDTTIDWTLPDGDTVPRFYHIYDRDEFVSDMEAAGLEIQRCWVSAGNCYGTVRP